MKTKINVLHILLVFVLLLGISPCTYAITVEEADQQIIRYAAQSLYEMGLFQGVGTNADGTQNFDLDRTPTRAEAVTMLVRLLGKENDALRGTWTLPFQDVIPSWAYPYIGYAYSNGLVSGISDVTFGSNVLIDANQYTTLLLRALGYSSDTDFQWDAPFQFTQTNLDDFPYEYHFLRKSFTRGFIVYISYYALGAPMKDGTILVHQLITQNSINEKAILPLNHTGVYSKLYEYNGKVYSGPELRGLRHDLITHMPYIDITASRNNWRLLENDIDKYFSAETDNPFVDGTLVDSYQIKPSDTYEITFIRKDYLSATDYLSIYEITYNGKTFTTPGIEDLTNPVSEEWMRFGAKDGVRYILLGTDNIGVLSLSMNDLAAYFGIDRRFIVNDPDRQAMGDGAFIIQ